MLKKTRSMLLAMTFLSVSLTGPFMVSGRAVALSDQAIVGLTNQERVQAGLPALNWNGTLSTSALLKVQDMCAKDYWAHNSPDGLTPWTFMDRASYRYYTAGENLANGYATDAAVVAGWMASPGHRANILNSAYVDIGVASMRCVLQGNDVTVVVAHYGATYPVKAEVPAEPAPVKTTPKPTAVQANLSKVEAAKTPVQQAVHVEAEKVTPTQPGLAQLLAYSEKCSIAPALQRDIKWTLLRVAHQCP